jgi:hypothetical protein
MEPTRPMLTLAEIERRHILDTLTCCRGSRTRTAKILGISIRGLRIKLHNYIHAGCDVCSPIRREDDRQFFCEQPENMSTKSTRNGSFGRAQDH